MGRVPVLKPQEVVTLLRSHGFEEIRQRGSHKQFRHPDGRVTSAVSQGAGHRTSPAPADRLRRRHDHRWVPGQAV